MECLRSVFRKQQPIWILANVFVYSFIYVGLNLGVICMLGKDTTIDLHSSLSSGNFAQGRHTKPLLQKVAVLRDITCGIWT